MQSTVYLITLRLLILPLNRLPSQHEGGVSILGYPDQPTNHFVLPTPVARGGSLPLGALSYFAYLGAMADLQAFRDR